MNKCTNCGTELPDGVTACPTCGNPVGNPVIPAAGQPANTPAAPTPPKKKGLGLKIIIGIIVIFFALFAIGSCATCSSNSSNSSSNQQEPWPTGPLAQMIPSMDKTCDYAHETEESLSIRVDDNVSKSDYSDYIAECKERGFTVDADEKSTEYVAHNAEGYRLRVWLSEYSSGDEISIDLETPKANGELIWPTVGLATLIPNPNKTKGSIDTDNADSFCAYVGEMTKTDFDTYVNRCIDEGFTIDHSKSDKSYSAKNNSGDSLKLEYRGFNTVYIYMHKPYSWESPDSSSETKSSSSNTSSSSSSSSSSTSSSNNSGVKAAMDEYEKVVDGYVAFMEKYRSSSNPASMASDYNKWIEDCAAATEKIEEIDESKLNATDLAYYNEVMLRCADKLLEASS